MSDAATAAPEGMSYTTRLRWRAARRVALFTAVLAAFFGAIVWQRMEPAVAGTPPLWSLEGAQPLAFADGGDTLLCNSGNFPATNVVAYDADDGTRGSVLISGYRTVVVPLPDGTIAASTPLMGQAAGGMEFIRSDGSVLRVGLPVTVAEYVAALPPASRMDAKASLNGVVPVASPVAIEEAGETGLVRVRATVLAASAATPGYVLLEADVDPATGAVSNRSVSHTTDPTAATLYGVNYVSGTVSDLTDFGVASGELPPVNSSTLRSYDAGDVIAAVWMEPNTNRPATIVRVWTRSGGSASIRRELILPIRKSLFSSETPVAIVVSPDGSRLAIGTVGGPGGQTVYVFDVSPE